MLPVVPVYAPLCVSCGQKLTFGSPPEGLENMVPNPCWRCETCKAVALFAPPPLPPPGEDPVVLAVEAERERCRQIASQVASLAARYQYWSAGDGTPNMAALDAAEIIQGCIANGSQPDVVMALVKRGIPRA